MWCVITSSGTTRSHTSHAFSDVRNKSTEYITKHNTTHQDEGANVPTVACLVRVCASVPQFLCNSRPTHCALVIGAGPPYVYCEAWDRPACTGYPKEGGAVEPRDFPARTTGSRLWKPNTHWHCVQMLASSRMAGEARLRRHQARDPRTRARGGTHVLDLPPELLNKVFSYLSNPVKQKVRSQALTSCELMQMHAARSRDGWHGTVSQASSPEYARRKTPASQRAGSGA